MDEATKLIVKMIEGLVPRIEQYRAKQVNKYWREKELDFGGEYQKLERYKNRVRVCDIFLPVLREVVVVKIGPAAAALKKESVKEICDDID